MAEQFIPNPIQPTPIQVTERAHKLAAGQGVDMLDVNEADLAAALETTGRTDLAEGGVAFQIGASKRFGGDGVDGPMFSGRYIGNDEPALAGEIGPGRTVIRLQVEDGKPVTAADLAQRTAEALLIPARMGVTIRRALGGLGLAAGGLAEIPAFALYMHNDGNFTPGTLGWLVGGALSLVAGGVSVNNGNTLARKTNNAEQRAAALAPITVVKGEATAA